MKKLFVALSVFVLPLISPAAFAQDLQLQFSPADQQMMMNQMIPVMEQMMKTMMKAQLDVLAEQKTAKQMATYTKNLYDALIEQGFSKEESLEIAMRLGFPAMPNMSN